MIRSKDRPTEAQRVADVRDAIDAARAEGNSLQAARLWVEEAARRVRVAEGDVRYENNLPKARQSPERTRKAKEALTEACAVLERARDALRPLETEDALRELRALREARETPLFVARVHRFSNQGRM